ncbi:MAG: hypothetical protein JO025_07795 [Verrucomicrobia bacterium]|nr:hypothetical protein [Verrucomicrobiota bacterium]
MFETTGEITDVQEFSDTDDQVTSEFAVPSPPGEEGETRANDWILPKGSAKVGDVVRVEIRPGK